MLGRSVVAFAYGSIVKEGHILPSPSGSEVARCSPRGWASPGFGTSNLVNMFY